MAPGTGKTTLVNSLLRTLSTQNLNIKLCAPTGRAAKRLSESTGLEATTIHRLLEIDPAYGGFKHNDESPLLCDYLVIDEASMVDISLFHALLKAIPPHSALLIVGDVDQLPYFYSPVSVTFLLYILIPWLKACIIIVDKVG